MSGRLFTRVPKQTSATPTRRPADPVPKRSPRVQEPVKPHSTRPEDNPSGGAAFDFTKIPIFPPGGRATVQAKPRRGLSNPYFMEPVRPRPVVQRQTAENAAQDTSIRTRLTVGKPNDQYEQEADRVAERVMRMPEPGIQRQEGVGEEEENKEKIQTKPLSQQITPLIQRQSENAPEEEEDKTLQASAAPGQTPAVTPGVASGISAMRGGGQPLSPVTRAFMEPRFGHDFSQVHIHADNNAAKMSQQINARAFTVGRDIAFAVGEYQPNTSSGRKLLAHELTHVVQQGAGQRISRQSITGLSSMKSADKVMGYLQRLASGAAPAAPPKLTKKTVAGPTDRDCGGFSWTVQWVLGKKTTKGGWVVQKVNVNRNVTDCAGTAKAPGSNELNPSWYPIWEAWKINKNQKVTTYAEGGDVMDDGYGSGAAGNNTKGSVEVVGKAEFYDGLKLPSSFKVTNKAPAWILPVTKSDPGLTGGSGAIDHNLKAEWSCCPESSSKKTKLTPT